jgi:hypothetical protein
MPQRIDSARAAEDRITKQDPKMAQGLISTGIINHFQSAFGQAAGENTATITLQGFWRITSVSIYTESISPETGSVFIYRQGNDFWQPLVSGECSLFKQQTYNMRFDTEGDWRVYGVMYRAQANYDAWLRVSAEKLSPGRSDQ